MKLSTTILILILLINTYSSFSRDLTWTGATSSDWNDSTNFTPAYVPTSADTVNIVSATNNPVLNGNTTLFSLNIQSGILDLDGYELKILKYSVFDGGIITGGIIQVEGNASFSGTEFESIVTASCAEIELNGSIFNEKSYFEITGTLPSEWHGGNIFHDSVIIVLNGSGNLFLTMQDPDQFLGTLNVINHTSHIIYLSYGDTAYYHEMISVANYHGGVIHFGKYGGVAMLQNNGSLIAERDSFNSGFLNLNDIYQLNSEYIILELAGDATLQMADCNFQGQFELVSPDILIRNSIFNGRTSLTKSGGVANVCEGGNTFMDTTTIINLSDRYSLTMHNTTGNIFHGKAIIQSDRGGINFGATATTPQEEFYSDIEVNSSYITFKKVVLTGSANQELGGTSDHSYNYIEIDKPSGYVTATTPISVVNQFVFTSGNLITDTVNYITFLASSEATGAHNGSFVNGPVNKVGDTEFEFPVGKANNYRPLGISATLDVENKYYVEYFDFEQSFSNNLDTNSSFISDCNFWQINRINGSDDVYLSLSFDTTSCHPIGSFLLLSVMSLFDTVWVNKGQDTIIGNYFNAKINSNLEVNEFNYVTWGFKRIVDTDCILPELFDPVNCTIEFICNGGMEQGQANSDLPNYPLGPTIFHANGSEIINWIDNPLLPGGTSEVYIRGNWSPVLPGWLGIPHNYHTNTTWGATITSSNCVVNGLNTHNGTGNDRYVGFEGTSEGLSTNLITHLIPDVNYELTFWAHVNGCGLSPVPNTLTRDLLVTLCSDIDDPNPIYFPLPNISITNDLTTPHWNQYTINFSIPAGSTVNYENVLFSGVNGGYFFIDDVSLTTTQFAFFTNTPPCIDEFVQFTSYASDPSTTFLWEFGDGTTNTTQSPQHTYTEPGYYEVVLTVSTTNCTDCFRRVIYVSPSCCAVDPGNVTYLDNTQVPDNIDADITWDDQMFTVPFRINRTITVDPDVTLTIEANSVIEFGPEGRIILDRRGATNTTGARMIMEDNSVLTSISNSITGCPVMWRGVEVWGHSTINHFSTANRNAHGMLTMGWEARIANAHNGVILGRTAFPFGDTCNPPIDDVDFPPFNIDFGGGILLADEQNCIFEKNGNGIRIFPYRFQNTSIISGCHFLGGQLLDDFYDLNNPSFFYTATTQPNRNPWYNEANTLSRASRGIWVWGNNRMWIFEENEMSDIDKGMETFDSNIRTIQNNFNNHRFGIDVFNTFSFNTRATQHHGNIFEQINLGLSSTDPCWINVNNAGIRINAGWNDQIWYGNIFGDIQNPYLTHTQPYDFNGVVVIGSDKTSIKDNEFGQAAIGVLMLNTSKTSGYIGFGTIGNKFLENKYGIGTNGSNINLKVRCNLWHTSDFICNNPGSIPVCWINGGTSILPPQQGSSGINPKKPAGNEFNTWDFDGPDKRISSQFPYVYYHHNQTGDLSTIPIPTSATITLFDNGIAKTTASCPSLARTTTELRDALDSLEVIQDSLLIKKEEIEEWIDSVNTESLISAINDSIISSENLRDSLLNNSPLDDQVLIALMNRFDKLEEEDFEMVMNMNLPISNEVISDYLNVLLAISDTRIVDSLTKKQGDNPFVYTLFGIQRELENIRNENFSYIYDLADYYIENDSIDQYMDLMESVDDIYFKMSVIGIYLNDGQTAIVNEKLSAINDSTEAYLDWKNIILMISNLSDSGKTVFSMDSTMKSMVFEIASKTEPTMAVMNAISIMRLVYGMEFNNFTMDFGYEESRMANANELKPVKQNITENRIYNVFPNPAKDRIFIQRMGSSSDEAIKVVLTMTDITGRLVAHEINFINKSHIEMDVTNLKAGFYLISIEDSYGISESHKLILEK